MQGDLASSCGLRGVEIRVADDTPGGLALDIPAAGADRTGGGGLVVAVYFKGLIGAPTEALASVIRALIAKGRLTAVAQLA